MADRDQPVAGISGDNATPNGDGLSITFGNGVSGGKFGRISVSF